MFPFRPSQDCINEFCLTGMNLRLGERDGFVDRSVWWCFEIEKLVKTKLENIGDDGLRRRVGQLRDQEFERKLPAQATVKQFGDETAVRATERGRSQRFFEKFVGQSARFLPVIEQVQGEFAGVHAPRLAPKIIRGQQKRGWIGYNGW